MVLDLFNKIYLVLLIRSAISLIKPLTLFTVCLNDAQFMGQLQT